MKRKKSRENLFVKRFLPAPLSKNFYILFSGQHPLGAEVAH
jgi:hypothetical protein